uniref:RING-type E3 ubiquitin transferase n=1 Tax=Salmo trutta TaxID=8032 RepID=A0A674BBP2_SALTR
DFNLDPNEDRLFVWAGEETGSWESNAVELTVTKWVLHGFLVEGILVTDQTVSIPYQYLVYSSKKATYEYEYIDFTHPTRRRSLCVKTNLLDDEGAWHQYDDIICASPSKDVSKRIIQGREIAGKIMLQTIFELLHSWNDIQLNSFMKRLIQFEQIYRKPSLYAGTNKNMKKQQTNKDSKSEGKLFERFQINRKFGKLISAIIQKTWPRDNHGNKDEVVFQHLMTWTAAKNIFELHGTHTFLLTINLIVIAKSLLFLCAIAVYFGDMEERQLTNIEDMTLDQFMKVHPFDQPSSGMHGVVTYFDLDQSMRQMADVWHMFGDSHIFKMLWEKQTKDFASEVDSLVTPKEVTNGIFRPCYTKYRKYYEGLKNGSLKLKKVDILFNDYKDNKHWIKERIQQIEQYHGLHLAVKSAKVIMKVKETLNLRGDFKALQTLLDIVRKHLDQIDNDLMQAKTDLVDITEPRRLCLLELGHAKDFVIWVKEALKVFVDLASISAGENDLDVDRVACFHDAVHGYSPLLFELKQDSGFQTVKEVMKKLWRTLDNDCNLPKKLHDTARHLEWLKTVKDFHGSVELSSISLATAINKKGVYTISAQNQKKLSLETSLKLHISEEHGEEQEIRAYSLEDLRELQNKLMLMSGKGDQPEVNRFSEVFASVQRLAVAFIALFTAGNPLFRNWKANINCNSLSEEADIIMDFNLGSVVSMITVEGNIVNQLPELCRKLEKCLKYWNDFMDKQRSHHYYLNYYNAEQIVYLCSKLTQQNVADFEDQVLMMLSFVKPNCTASDLRQSLHALQSEILTIQSEQNEEIECHTFVEVSRKVNLIWNAYMRDMKNFLPDTLDVRSFGRFLEILANKKEYKYLPKKWNKKTIQRDLPKGLAIGSPNLIVCPHDEILASCISVYMSSECQPLPTYDEVILCNSTTPFEQVELFLRRCLTPGYRGQKIYTMLYGDQLSYEVSSKTERFFKSITMQCRKDYRLVIICSSDREHTYLPSAFSQYRLHMVPQEPLIMIQRYLNRHYTVPADQTSAAAVFKDRQFVGVVSSERAGVGKSLYIKRLFEKLKDIFMKATVLKCIRLIKPTVDENVILQSLLNNPGKKELTIFHFDVTSTVRKGLDECLFKLLVLGYLMDSEGRMWKCSNKQLYVIEILQSTVNQHRNEPTMKAPVNFTFLDVFPNVFCRPPNEILELEMRIQQDPSITKPEDPLMDDQEFKSDAYQRPYQYLTRSHNHINLDRFMYSGVEGTHVKCLQLLLLYCGIKDPSWAELRNFTWFLNLQLRDCETSVFCDASITGDTLQGFKNFVVEFMILMAKDFATPSLSISDQSPGKQQITGIQEEDLAPFRIRKRWESEPHPYIFFNDDHMSMTFIGFHLQPNKENWVDAVDPSTGSVIKRNIMTKKLFDGLTLQRVPFNIDFDELSRQDKIECICNVMGIRQHLDPDETYELTTDNILKMLAILMRFRCSIPVVIMGETGCGKTRLINFLCELQKRAVTTQNMKLVKVHGGTSSDMIYANVREAEAIAYNNKQSYGFDSVLFFDEANTTDALSSIKEVICDHTVEGEPLQSQCGLQIIAACNPYRKHTDEMIHRLETAGLGYRVRAEETDEKLGSIPLRQLVYRVQALPPSMIPLVWDFGQLNDHTENMYIKKIVKRVVQTNMINVTYASWITNVLSASQRYMRKRKDECSFVSLRDVERCMQAFVWFYKNHKMLLADLWEFERNQIAERRKQIRRDPVLWSLVMAVGVCYHACLENKEEYRQNICKYLTGVYTPLKVMQEISLMQDLFLSGVPLGETIARNNALKENVFMIVICIELRIPLFLVGKPGSSKSLSKTLVADAMQGQAAHSDLYKRLKQIHLVSFQCSPHSTPAGIINTFKQCARFQEGKNLKEYISVVVLDEIGLAEDSPKMPLKTLHPLLEEGCIDDEPLPHKKVGFIAISNWALDPAKMNRGIFVSRGDPDEKELIESAKGICSSDTMILEKVRDFFQPFARAFLKISPEKGKGFFGLRDYYSLIKMLFAITKASEQIPSAEKIVEAVLRNFSGRDDVDAVTVFTETLKINPNLERISAIELVRQNISAQEEDCRYLLLLTKNYAALQILQQTFFSEKYTQICRNINRIKICMETGRTVVLLNLQNLYESLYDALNQYYVCLGGQKYVDLGLGTHRVKCRVHKDFRLIVIEDKEVVYNQFPIPLINRLEKHYLDIHTVLSKEQREIVEDLERWVGQFVDLRQSSPAPQTYKYQPPDVFIGFHADTCASVVRQVTENQRGDMDMPDQQRRVLDEAKLILVNCATPDSVARLDCTGLSKVEIDHLTRFYYEERKHSSLADFVCHTQQVEQSPSCFIEVTTFSRLLTESDIGPLKEVVHNVELLSLQQFDTELSFRKKIREFLTPGDASSNKLLVIQSDLDEASHNASVIASAKYSAINEINKSKQEEIEGKVFVYFITKLLRLDSGTSFVGFCGGPWRSVHIDDLRRSKDIVSDIRVLRNLAICQLFEESFVLEHFHFPWALYLLQGWKDVLDTTLLLRSCVQSAVGMLRDQMEGGFRNTRRVEILLTLLTDDEEKRAGFLRILKRRLHSSLETREKNTNLTKNWVISEASNIDALHEGGTFRQTLWKRVQAVVIPLLAQLVSVIDRDGNLDLLLDTNSEEPIKRLWLDIFADDKLLDVPFPYSSVDNKNISCIMPFSWRIRDYLDELWIYALQHEGQTQRQLEKFFGKTPLGRYIAIADNEMQTELFHRYLQDFITMTMNVTCEEDLQVGFLFALSPLISHDAVCTEVASLPWVHAAYNQFKNRLQNLSRMISIPRVGQGLLVNTHIREGMELVLDVYAALACVEHLEPLALETDAQRLHWLRQVKRLQVPIELVCSEESRRHYGERSKAMVCRVHRWNRIFVLSLFVEHLLLGVEKVDKRLKPFISASVRRLCHVSFHLILLSVIFNLMNVKQFKKKCSAFFIDLVSTVCFKDNSPPCTTIIHHLLSFLTVEAQSSPIIRGTLLPSDGLSLPHISCPFFFITHYGPTEREFLTSVGELCKRSGNDWYRVYLIRTICKQHGVDYVQHFLTVADMQWLFPYEVLQKVLVYIQGRRTTMIDQYLVCGEDYKTIRDVVAKAILEGTIKEIDRACKGSTCPKNKRTMYLLLALFREVTCLYREANPNLHPKSEFCQALVDFIQASTVLASRNVKEFALDLVANRLGPLTVQTGASGAQWVVVELAIHLSAVLLCGNQGLLIPLQQLALLPTNMQRAFIPTMPEDKLAVVRQAIRGMTWYSKYCFITVLKNENVFSCLFIRGDSTETGHVLGDPGRRDHPDMQDTKNMSSVPFNLVRLLTHIAMLLGARSNRQAIAAIIKPQVPDPSLFLMGHLLKDMEHVTRFIGKGRDDTVNAIHLMISSLLKPHRRGCDDNHLSTKEARNDWEMTVGNEIISPQLKDLDRRLQEVNAFIRDDSRLSSNPIMRVLSPEPRLFLSSLPHNSQIHSPAVWNCRERVSLLSLTRVVEQNDGENTLPVLWRFLHKEAELRLLKFITDILELQRNLVKTCRNVTDLSHGTISKFLQRQESVPLRAWYEKRINIFLTTWNQLRGSLATNGEIKIPVDFCRKDLDMTTDFRVLLPRRQGPGLCSTALVSYLIALQNELVYCVDKHLGEETSFKVSPADLTDLHVIQYDLERDLLPLILSNCQYSMKQGKDTLHEYDLPKIQQQILSRFLQGRPIITLNGIPTLVNRHDRIHEIILKDMRGKIGQVPLPSRAVSTLVGELKSYNEVCEALSTVEVALGFLAVTGGEPHMQLGSYLEEVLQMGDQTAPHILTALGRYYLKHCLALWQLLTSLKSENMLWLKRDPFEGISEEYRKALGEEEHRLLTGFFNKSSADSILLEMHEFLILVLKPPNASDTYSLKDTLVAYMERKNLDIPPDVEEFFPEEIELSQYIEAWKFAVALKRERSQR